MSPFEQTEFFEEPTHNKNQSLLVMKRGRSTFVIKSFMDFLIKVTRSQERTMPASLSTFENCS